jgi:hypothetical protein
VEWQPISESDFSDLLREEIQQLDTEGRLLLETFRIDRERKYILPRTFDGSTPIREPVFVVARSGALALFSDDVEEEFGIATLDEDGAIRDWGTSGRLQWALRGLTRQVERT